MIYAICGVAGFFFGVVCMAILFAARDSKGIDINRLLHAERRKGCFED